MICSKYYTVDDVLVISKIRHELYKWVCSIVVMCIIPKQDHGFITYGLSQTQKHKTQTHINYPCTDPLIIKAHSHWRIVEFQAEPQNLLFSAEFLFLWNSAKFDKTTSDRFDVAILREKYVDRLSKVAEITSSLCRCWDLVFQCTRYQS